MASYHHTVKRGKKGDGADHAAYIARQGKFAKRADLVLSGHGNMPEWAEGNPRAFWRQGDKYERANGAVYREHVIALPKELTNEQQKELARELVSAFAANKPFQFAVHAPMQSLGSEPNPHLHLMYSDRVDDGIQRDPAQTFSRYNPKNPELGGRRKAGCGRGKLELRDELIATRKLSAEIQNAVLARHGHAARVDHRSLEKQGLSRQAERHLGPARINNMSDQEKSDYVSRRTR